MRYTKAFIPTLKESPQDAEAITHKLMVRAGLIRKLTAGAYTYLPLGFKVLKKVEAIINSMTPTERQNPGIIDGSRRRRISRGSGTTPQDINQVLNQFRQVRKIMKMIPGGKLPKGMLGGMIPHSK